MIPFALTQSDVPNRTDAVGGGAEPDQPDRPAEPGPEPEIAPGTPERPEMPEPENPETEMPEPEIAPGLPERRDIPDPEFPPPDRPEITPPDTPSPPSDPSGMPLSSVPEADALGRSDEPDSPYRTRRPELGAEGPPVEPEHRAVESPRVPAFRPTGAPPPAPAAKPKHSALQRAVLALLLIGAAGMIGYVLSSADEPSAEPDALARSVEAAGNLRLLLRTSVPAEAREFVREEFGWRVGVPVFDAVALTGVAIAQAAAAVEVPVFLYADEEDRNVAVFAYSYALLDQVPDRLRLTGDDYEDLADGDPTVQSTDSGDVLLWRDRDDIYVAVTDLPPDALSGGLTMDR